MTEPIVTEPIVTELALVRLGLLLPRTALPRWVLTSVEAIRSAGDAELVVVGRVDGAGEAGPGVAGPGAVRPGLALRALLAAYQRLDRRIFGRIDDPTLPADPGPALAGLLHVEVEPDATAEAIAGQLEGHRLDVLLQFGGPDLADVAGRIARHGVWSHRITLSDGAPGAALPSGLAEVLGGPVVTSAGLSATIGGERRLVAWTVSATDRISVARGMRGHLAKVAWLAPRALRDLRQDGRPPQPPELQAAATPAGPGSAAGLAGQLLRLGLGFVGRRIERTVAPDRWIVALAAGPTPGPLPDPARSPLQHLLPPAGRGWADPFLVRFEGQTLLFVEEWVDLERRGRIALVRLDESRRPGPPETVLSSIGHLSYPQVFQWRDTWYLLPEQAARGGLQLYRAESFPTTWTFDRTLVADPPLADATIAEIDGRWWLFAAAKAPGGTSADELLLYSADEPIGPWRAHARNPVLSDIRAARPAGALVQRDGQWYRPSQDGSVSYGWALNLNRIDRLDDQGYRETRVAQLQPNWHPDVVGTHTLAEAGDLTAIDLSVRWPKLGRRSFRAD